jgi:ABC-type glycerol-3-phosphate transport system substrate-binding protein
LKKLLVILGIVVLLAGALSCAEEEASPTPTQATPAPTATVALEPFMGLDDVPVIADKDGLFVVLQGNVGEGALAPFLQKFSDKTGVPIQYEEMIMSVLYPRVNVELISGSGAYDVICIEASSTNEWGRYLYSFQDLASQYDPMGIEGLYEDVQERGLHPTIYRACCDAQGNLMGLPYYTYQQCTFYREDVYTDPTEMANFTAQYGYDLAPPETWAQVHDQAEFFTREPGELLKGEPVTEKVYGITLMAGRYEINDEISVRLWSKGGHWATPVRDSSGEIIEFVITKEDKELLAESLEEYIADLEYASPGCLTGFWDFCTAQIVAGLAIMDPHLYIPLDQWGYTVEQDIPGAVLSFDLSPGPIRGCGYVGTFNNGVVKTTRNPEAAYWLCRYLSSYEVQKELTETGWSAIRMDVYDDPKYDAPEWQNLVEKRATICSESWDALEPLVNDILHFNSDAMGKIYEEQIIICHDAVTGQITVEEAVRQLTETTIDLQTKFGTVPISEET